MDDTNLSSPESQESTFSKLESLLYADLSAPRYDPIKDKALERKLIAKAQEGDVAARNRLAEANLRLVSKYALRYDQHTLWYLDLFNEGVLGLIEAIGRFDLSYNVRLSSYAGHWIFLAITSAMYRDFVVKRNLNDIKAANKILKARRDLERSGDISNRDLAYALNMPLAEIEAALAVTTVEQSLNVPLDDDDDDADSTDRLDTVRDVVDRGPLTTLERSDTRLCEDLDAAVRELNDWDRGLVERIIGVDGRGGETRAEVARQMGVSCQKVSQSYLGITRRLRGRVHAGLLAGSAA